jgi:hypothetical protein
VSVLKPPEIELESQLENLPDFVANALEKWRTKTLDRDQTEALLYLRFKGEDTGRTATEIKAMVNADDTLYAAALEELKAESNYIRLYERLMALKKRADLRTAY